MRREAVGEGPGRSGPGRKCRVGEPRGTHRTPHPAKVGPVFCPAHPRDTGGAPRDPAAGPLSTSGYSREGKKLVLRTG